MPIYCYTTKDGQTVERLQSVARKRIRLPDGRWALRDRAAERHGNTATAKNWPMESDALGVNPDQAQEAYEASVRAGVPTQFDRETGCAILESASHRRKLARSLGMHDNNAGYSDPVPD